VRFVRLALNVVRQNDGDFVDVILLYMRTDRYGNTNRSIFYNLLLLISKRRYEHIFWSPDFTCLA